MGTARQDHASAAVGGKLYVFGGLDGDEYFSTAEVYDPASNSWAQVTSLTSARGFLAGAAL
jgi:kelch-like protein 20